MGLFGIPVLPAMMYEYLVLDKQCCGSGMIYSGSGMIYSGSGMIYSGSGNSYEFLKFRIRIQPILFKHFEINKKKQINFNQKDECTVQCNYLPFFYFIFQFYRTHSPEFTGLKLEIHVCFRIHADPDTQHCFGCY